MLKSSISDDYRYSRRFIELDANGTLWKEEVYAHLIHEFTIDDWSIEELLTSYELCFCGFCRFMPGARAAIEKLHVSGYKLGLISNGKSPFQERNFNALGVSHLFSTIVVSEAVGFRKPEPDIFELACELMGCKPSESVFVGDNPVVDIDGAKRSGLYTIYKPGRFKIHNCNADAVCTDFSELAGLVKNFG